MRLSIECKCITNIKSSEDIWFKLGEREYFFLINNENNISKIKIIDKVPNPEKFYSKVERNQKPIKITIEVDEAFFNKLIKEFQKLESSLSFSYHINKINWEDPKVEVIPESEEEKQTQILGYNFTREYPKREYYVETDELKDHVINSDKYKELTLVKSFYREGMNDYNSLRYINAFYSFYFIIEGIYGNGKTRNRAIESEFLNSQEYIDSIQNLIDTQILTNKEHKNSILSLLNYYNKQMDVEGITHVLVNTRGRLHHFVKGSSLIQGTPFNQRDFHSIAFLSMGIALKSILFRIVEINNLK